MKRYLWLAACAVACTVNSGKEVPPVTTSGGSGVIVDPATQAVSVDPSVVPVVPSCAAGTLVERTASGWTCVSGFTLDAGAGLSESAGVLSVDESHIPYVLDCAAGQVVSRVAGGWDCVTPAGTSAGVGLIASGGGLSVDSAQVALASNCGAGQIAVDSAAGWTCTSDFLRATAATGLYLGLHAKADSAGDSDTLDGLDAGAFVRRDADGGIAVGSGKIIMTYTAPDGGATVSYTINGVFCGTTATQTTGAVTDGAAGTAGYRAVKTLCEKVPGCGPAAHLCSVEEAVRSYQVGAMQVRFTVSNGWLAGDFAGEDCGGFENANSAARAPILSGQPGTPNGSIIAEEPCDQSYFLACCN